MYIYFLFAFFVQCINFFTSLFKIILLGDSAVGKSKLVERYLMDDYNPRQVRNDYLLNCMVAKNFFYLIYF